MAEDTKKENAVLNSEDKASSAAAYAAPSNETSSKTSNETSSKTSNEATADAPQKIGLFQQIIRFGLVGIICFLIDFGLTMVLKMCGVYYMIAAFFGFVVSVIVNYILSFKLVFTRKENMSRKTAFIAFVILSAIGCVINEIVIWLCVDCVYSNTASLMAMYNDNWAVAIGKVVATAVVMFYNFITRKKFLSAD